MLVAFCLSIPWQYGYVTRTHGLGCSRGAVEVITHIPRDMLVLTIGNSRGGWYWERARQHDVDLLAKLIYTDINWLPKRYQIGSVRFCRVPLWITFLAVLHLTIILDRALRKRHVRGRCNKCDYDLRHNTSGVCPECGTEIKA